MSAVAWAQSIDQTPVPAPMPHAPKVSPTSALHKVTARMTVTTDPIITACHADIRRTGSSSTMGISAMGVLLHVESAGLSDWTNAGKRPRALASRLPWETRRYRQ